MRREGGEKRRGEGARRGEERKKMEEQEVLKRIECSWYRGDSAQLLSVSRRPLDFG